MGLFERRRDKVTSKRSYRRWTLTSAGRLLAAPGQALLTNPALRTHQLITRMAEEVDLVANALGLAQLPPIGGCFQFWAGACKKTPQH